MSDPITKDDFKLLSVMLGMLIGLIVFTIASSISPRGDVTVIEGQPYVYLHEGKVPSSGWYEVGPLVDIVDVTVVVDR